MILNIERLIAVHLIALLIAGILCACTFSNTSTHLHILAKHDSVVLECNIKPDETGYWKYENELISFKTFVIDDKLDDTHSLFQNYSLLIVSVLPAHEGIYSCKSSSRTFVVHVLEVQGLYTISANAPLTLCFLIF